ncbi:hypothetical protein LCGC14_0585380 [marine sediment metagenome]|uniref:Uncharacterized protein n=1 Tax=marine sediment metagenome TaxID=412755 RepID=A0A0F9U1E0_9ZZZZ
MQQGSKPLSSRLVDAAKALTELAPHGHPKFNSLLIEMATLHSKKNADYAGEVEALGNFTRVAKLLEMYPLFSQPQYWRAKVAIVNNLKQFDAVMNALSEGRDLKTDSILTRIDDMIVYWTIVRIMIEEEDIETSVQQRST